MIFRQLFDSVSGTYTYLLASRHGGEALIIDPVLEKVDRYLQLVTRARPQAGQGGRHASACRPHHRPWRTARPHPVHHRDGRAEQGSTWCRCGCADGDKLTIEGLALDVLYTPGHTDDSYSFLMGDRVFTGDTLLIRGTGRTDFQNGDPRAQYDSIFSKLLKLPDETHGVSRPMIIRARPSPPSARKKRSTRGCKVKSVDEYVELMNNLNLPNPKMMDVAVPANMRVGLPRRTSPNAAGRSTRPTRSSSLGRPDVALIDLAREVANAKRTASFPARCTRPTRTCRTISGPAACCMNSPRRPASGSYSTAPSANARRWPCRPRRMPASSARHIHGGIDAWKKAGRGR